jgi:hypothetical protein
MYEFQAYDLLGECWWLELQFWGAFLDAENSAA